MTDSKSFVVYDVSPKKQNLVNLAVVRDYVNKINKSNLITKSDNGVIFDVEGVSEENIEGTNINFFSVPQVGYDEDSDVNFGAGFLVGDGDIRYICYVKEEKLEDNSKLITYLRPDFTPFMEVYVDGKNKEVTTSYVSERTIKTRLESEDGDTGDCVAKCIDRIYTQGSWASVIIWCASAVCWQVPVAVAMTCATECSLGWPPPGVNQ